MNKKAKILFFCMIFVAKAVFCQKSGEKMALAGDLFSLKPPLYTSINSKINDWTPVNNKKGPVTVSLISPDHYTQCFGFFCKKELQFEKTTGVSVKFRLGTVQYCDWMEGKKGAGILPVQ